MINPKRFCRSLKHAVRGVKVVFKNEHSFRIQIIAAILVIAASTWFQVRTYEWILILVLIGSVLSLEMINSILERIVDSFKPRIHPIVKDIKDIMAGTVFMASLFSAVIGIIIFYPYILELVTELG